MKRWEAINHDLRYKLVDTRYRESGHPHRFSTVSHTPFDCHSLLSPLFIQIDFMNALYDSLDKGGIAMLESPTGTGKTLSIICSALQWLVDRKQRQNNDSLVDMHPNGNNGDCVGSDEEPDWLTNSFGSKEVESPKKKVKVKKRLGFSSKQRDETEIEESFRDLYSQLREIEVGLEHNVIVRGDGERLDYKEFLVDEYESGDEKNGLCKRKGGGICCGSSSSDDEDEDKEFSDTEEETDFKIYFCCRTHLQISQFVKELRKTDFGNELKVACLGSRKNFCINEEVMKLGNSTLINERHLDLQKNKKSQISKKNLHKSVSGMNFKSKLQAEHLEISKSPWYDATHVSRGGRWPVLMSVAIITWCLDGILGEAGELSAFVSFGRRPIRFD